MRNWEVITAVSTSIASIQILASKYYILLLNRRNKESLEKLLVSIYNGINKSKQTTTPPKHLQKDEGLTFKRHSCHTGSDI